MNILFLSEPSYPRHFGGAGKGTHLLASGLAARGHTVRIACECSEASEVEHIEGVEVHRLNCDEQQALGDDVSDEASIRHWLAYLEAHIPLEELDVVIDGGGFLSYFTGIARHLKQKYRIAYIVQYRYLMARHFAALDRAARPLSRDALGLEACVHQASQCASSHMADAVVCVSQDDADFVEHAFRPATGRPRVIPEPIEALSVDEAAVQRIRAELVAPDEQLVHFGGRIEDTMKGPDIVHEAFARLAAARPSARLLLLIDTELSLEPYRRFGPRVIARPWVSDRATFANVLAAIDVLWMPSRYEPFGMLCAEALMVGRPVIAAAVGGLRDQIESGMNGFLVEPSGTKAMAQRIAGLTRRLFDEPELAQRFREHARLSAQRFRVETVALETEQLCERTLATIRADGPRTVRLPHFSERDRSAYLDLLEGWLGSRSRALGEVVIEQWPDSAPERCSTCTRRRLSIDAQELLRLRRASPGRLLLQLSRQWQRRVDQAVQAACPLGLLQKSSLYDPRES